MGKIIIEVTIKRKVKEERNDDVLVRLVARRFLIP